MIEKITTIITKVLPKSEVKVYGSHATKLCLPWSDIDLVICLNNDDFSNNARSGALSQVSYELKNGGHDIVLEVNYIENATVPVVKVMCKMDAQDIESKKYPAWIMQPLSIDIT